MSTRTAPLLLLPLLLSLSACATSPTIGASGARTVATGAAAVDANGQLEHCDRTLGTMAIVEESNRPWVSQLTAQYRTQSTVPLLRMIMQQSNCFAVVERGQAMRQMRGERELMEAGELPEGKVLAASFMDSYNQMVKAVRSDKAQSVEGGLGNGETLRTN